ncbi:MAG: tetratricopeptide repeat protein [Brevinematia bacterium]
MKKIFIFSLMLFLFCYSFGENYTLTPEEMYSEAMEKYNQGKFDEAINILKSLKSTGETNQYIYNLLIDTYIARLKNLQFEKDQGKYFSILKDATQIAREAYSGYPDEKQIVYKYIILLDEQGNYSEMQKPLSNLIQKDTNDLLANFYYGIIELLNRNYKNSERYFLVIVNSKNFTSEIDYMILYRAYVNLGQLQLENQNFFKAAYYYEKAREIVKSDYKVLINLVICYAEILEFNKAKDILENIPQFLWTEGLYELYGGLLFVNNDPKLKKFCEENSEKSSYLKSILLFEEAKYEESLNLLKQYSKNFPSPHFYIHYLFFSIYEKLSDKEMANKEAFLIAGKAELSYKPEMAIRFYRVIEKNDAGKPAIYWIIANLYNDISDYSDAIAYYEKYISHPEAKDYVVASYLKLSYLYYTRKEKSKSRQYLTKAEELAKTDDEKYYINFYSGLMLYDEKKYKMAIEKFKESLKIYPEDLKTLFFIGVCYYETEENKKAIEFLERAVKIQENDPEVNNLLAYIYANEKIKFEEALRLVDNALTYKPDNIAYLDTKAWIYYNRGEFEKSFEIFNRVERSIAATNESTPGFDEIFFHLSKIYDKMGNESTSKKYIEKIKKNFPKSKWLKK